MEDVPVGLVASVSEPGIELVGALLLAQGGLVALGLILIDELDNAYGDVYSGSVAGHSLHWRWSVRRWGIALAILCTGLALVLPMRSLEPFLLMLSSVFVPLYGVIVARLAFRGDVATLVSARKVGRSAVAIWIVGVVLYHLLARLAPQWGAALPTLVVTATLAWATRGRLDDAGAMPAPSP